MPTSVNTAEIAVRVRACGSRDRAGGGDGGGLEAVWTENFVGVWRKRLRIYATRLVTATQNRFRALSKASAKRHAGLASIERQPIFPCVQRLEPRFVLNATAELNALGQLMITGDMAADIVQMDVDDFGGITLSDGSGNAIAITNHPGNSTDPLAAAEVTGGEVIIDLGGGDDSLSVEIPVGLDVRVLDDGGNDSVSLTFSNRGTAEQANSIEVTAESIDLPSTESFHGAIQDAVRLIGDVSAGRPALGTTLGLDGGSLLIDGSLTLRGDFQIDSGGGNVDLSSAVVSASSAETTFSVFADDGSTGFGDVQIGDADSSAGFLVGSLRVDGANSVTLQSQFVGDSIDVDGLVSIQNVQHELAVRSDLTAGSVLTVSVNHTDLSADVTATDGAINVASDVTLDVSGDLTLLSSDASANIRLASSLITLTDSTIQTGGGDVTLSGASLVDGELQLVTSGGTATATGPISALDGSGDKLVIDTSTGSVAGDVVLQGVLGQPDGGSTIDLNEVRIDGGGVRIDDVSVSGGDVVIKADSVQANGNLIRTRGSGDIRFDAPVQLSNGVTRIESSGEVTLSSIVGDGVSSVADVNAGGDVRLDGDVGSVESLIVGSASQIFLAANVAVSDNVAFTATGGVQSTATMVTAGDRFEVDGRFDQNVDATIFANGFRFGGTVDVAGSSTLTIDGGIDSGSLAKSGDGVLLLNGNNTYSGPTIVEAGTLSVDGSIVNSTSVQVTSGGTLRGDGRIEAPVITATDARVTTATFAADSPTGLQIADLTLESGSVLDVDIDSPSVFDQLNVFDNSGNVAINGAVLDLSVNYAATPATEFVLIANDGTDAVSGVFEVAFDIDGSAIAGTRTITEGGLVLDDFGGTGISAYITYAGGDGNDVAVVTAGTVEIGSLGTTIVDRVGTNLHIRTGGDLAAAESATPTIRPIVGLSGHELIVQGSTTADSLLVDVDGFFNSSASSINFEGTIVFNGMDAVGSVDVIAITDRDVSTDDSVESVTYEFGLAGQGIVSVDSGIADSGNGVPMLAIRYDGTEAVAQTVESSEASLLGSGLDDTVGLRQNASFTDLTQST